MLSGRRGIVRTIVARLEVRCSDEQIGEIRRAAELWGMSVSEFVRARCLGVGVSHPGPLSEDESGAQRGGTGGSPERPGVASEPRVSDAPKGSGSLAAAPGRSVPDHPGLKRGSEVRYRCPAGCGHEATSPLAVCPVHGRKLVPC